MKRFFLWFTMFLCLQVSAQAENEDQNENDFKKYVITDLGAIIGGSNSSATGINDNNQIVGWASNNTPGQFSGFYYDYNSSNYVKLDQYIDSFMSDINNAGVAVGFGCSTAFCDGATSRAFYWDGSLHPIDGLQGFESSAYAINNSGLIVGGSAQGAFTYKNNELQLLGPKASTAWGVNDSGGIVGRNIFVQFDPYHGYVYKEGQFTDIGTIDGFGDSALNDINNKGVAVGWSNGKAIYYNGQINEFNIDGFNHAQSNAINNSNVIVGTAYNQGISDVNAFIYKDGKSANLNDLITGNQGWVLQDAVDINNRGFIVGRGIINGESHAYLAAPVPEPSTLFLLGGGLVGAFWRRRKIAKT